MNDPAGLRIVADDLTGALDSAAPFATPAHPVCLSSSSLSPHDRLTVSTETRNSSEREACATVRLQLARWGEAHSDTLWFKKVDTVLRGNPIIETMEMMETGRFDLCIFAPAFPAMGRVTRQGLHFTSSPGETERPAFIHDLVAAFRERGATAARLGESEDAQFLIGDAATQNDLEKMVLAWRGGKSLLWTGSRGLAGALAGRPVMQTHPPVELLVAGTTHPVTCAQMDALQAAQDGVRTMPIIINPVAAGAADPGETQILVRDGLLASAGLMHPYRTIVVIGGDTLRTVLDWAQMDRAECVGEILPGLPLTRLVGGKLDGMMLLSKSGGFGDRNLLIRLIAAAGAVPVKM